MQLIHLLLAHQAHFKPVIAVDWDNEKILRMDFTAHNTDLHRIDLTDTPAFSAYVFGKMQQSGAVAGVGGYDEDRYIYSRSAHFQASEQPRSIHLGVDIWMEAGTPVFAPLAGSVHSFQNNATFGDYGPTVILAHQLEGTTFHTLYGHLNTQCLETLFTGKRIQAGEQIAEIGSFPINGNWPPHLHFQLITDMEGKKGDYPGVCSVSERERYLNNCPDPNLMLGIRQLQA